MKKLVCLFSLLFLINRTALCSENLMPPDKKLHLEAGIIIGGGSYFICPEFEKLLFDRTFIHPSLWSIGMASLAGAGKEIVHDDMMERGDCNAKDFYYTVAGGVISGITLGIIDELFSRDESSVYLEVNPLNSSVFLSYLYRY
ncbi:MAG TPA: hypothetical protein PK906_02115 [Spirochaetota bacterium]|nr:hypothetical protein [Spirochaetota bacterium]